MRIFSGIVGVVTAAIVLGLPHVAGAQVQIIQGATTGEQFQLPGPGRQFKTGTARISGRVITTDAGTPGHGGIGWWSNAEGRYPRLPRDAFWGSGAGHQVVLVIPSLNLIAVRNGGSLGETMEHHDMLNAEIFAPLVAAVGSAKGPDQVSVAPSPVIRDLEWAPPATIRRAARGSDNWPLTWGDDDALYGAYGDGQGFEPFVPTKLSMGFARILELADDFFGDEVNVTFKLGEDVAKRREILLTESCYAALKARGAELEVEVREEDLGGVLEKHYCLKS